MALMTVKKRLPNKQKIENYFEKYPESNSKDVECMNSDHDDRNNKLRKKRREHNGKRKKIKLSSSIAENNPTDKKAEASPLVYTTRLDDMLVLSASQISFENNPNLLEDIEAESKPTFNIKSFPRKRRHPVCEQYYLLNRKLQNYFSIRVSNDEYVQTKSLLEIDVENIVKECEPLESCDDGKIAVREDTVIVEISDSDDEPPPKFKPRNTEQATLEQHNTNGLLKLKVFKNIPSSSNVYSNEPYVVILRLKENLNLAFSYKKNGNPSTLLRFKQCDQHIEMFKSIFSCKPTLIIYKCCWYRLFINIQQIHFVNFSTHHHECLLQHCRCCCIKKFKTDFSLIQDDSKNVKNKKSLVVKEETQKNMECISYQLRFQLLEKPGPSQIIAKALCNTITVTDLEKPFRNPSSKDSSPTMSRKSAVKSRTHTTDVYLVNEKMNLTESYTISPSGNILEYSIAPSHKNVTKKQATKLYSSCCCTCRNKIISEVLSKRISPASVRFMNRLHQCYHENFNCCELIKKVEKVNITLNSENLHLKANCIPKINFTSGTRLKVFFADNELNVPIPGYKKTEKVCGQNELNKLKSKAEIHVALPSSQDLNLCKKRSLGKRNRKNNTNYMNNDQPNLTRISTSTSTVTSSSIVHPATPVNSPTNITLPVENAPTNVNPAAVKAGAISQFTGDIANQIFKAIDEVPGAQVEKAAICQLIRNSRITLDSNGKATASLHKPFSLLSCAELDVLYKLLINAQKAADKSVSQLCTDVTNLPIQSTPNVLMFQKYEGTNESEKIELVKKCSVIAAGKSTAFKRLNTSFGEVLKEPLEESSTTMPIIDNVCEENELNKLKSKAEIHVALPSSQDLNPCKKRSLEKGKRKNNTNYMNRDQPNLTRISTSTSTMIISSIVHPSTPVYSPANITLPVANAPTKVNTAAVKAGAISQFTGDIANQVLKAIDGVPEAQVEKTAICRLFQNLHITLDSNGKATASFHKPLSLLSCVELNVLSKLLINAQEVADNSVSQPCIEVTNLPIQSTPKESEKLELVKKCSVTAARKSEESFGEVLKKPSVDSIKTMPVIDNVFSINQDQKYDAFSHCRGTPGPSGVSRKYNQSKINDVDMLNEYEPDIRPTGNIDHTNDIAWKSEVLNCFIKSFGKVLKEPLEDIGTTMPIIENVFSINQDQKYHASSSSHCRERTQGPSAVSRKENLSKMVDVDMLNEYEPHIRQTGNIDNTNDIVWKSEAFNFIMKSFDKVVKEPLEDISTMMPIIDNVFSINQDQKYYASSSSHCRDPIPGPSAVSRKENPSKIDDVDMLNEYEPHIKPTGNIDDTNDRFEEENIVDKEEGLEVTDEELRDAEEELKLKEELSVEEMCTGD